MYRSLQRPLVRASSRCTASVAATNGYNNDIHLLRLVRSLSSKTTEDKPVKLHTEWVPGQNDSISDIDSNQPFSVLFLHGLLGSGRNLKTFARQIVKQRQQDVHGGILVDLRGHGKSHTSNNSNNSTTTDDQKRSFTFQHAVEDVEHTLEELYRESLNIEAPTRVVVGHSYGGRLALEYAAAASANGTPLEALWLLDTVPGQAHDSVDQVIAAVSTIVESDDSFDRKELVQMLTESYGMDMGVAQWLASSYNAKTGDFGFDLSLVQDLKPEFAIQDFVGLLRSILEQNGSDAATTTTTDVHLVRGGKNAAWSVQVLAELEALAKEFPSTFHMHVLPTAGHWVHVDDLPGLVNLFVKHS